MSDVEIVPTDDTPTTHQDAAPIDEFRGARFDTMRDVLNTLHKLAGAISEAKGFVPDNMYKQPGKILACFLIGTELGVGPMSSLDNIGIDNNGRRYMSGKMQAALVRRAGHSLTISSDSKHAEVTGIRADNGDKATVVWDLEKALQAGLIDRIDDDGRAVARSSKDNPLPWEMYPHKMLYWRAMTELVDILFPEVLIGGLPTQVGEEFRA